MLTDASKNYDCITLKLEKALTLEFDQITLEDQRDVWLTLGYFDALRLQLPDADGDGENMVKRIYRDINMQSQHTNAKIYTHPLHIISNLIDDVKTERYRRFFEKNTPFLCVTFFQCSPLLQKSPIQLEQEAEALLEQTIEELRDDGQRELHHVIYQTLNLSDFVILWKTNSLQWLLKALQALHTSAFVGDLHSIPAVRYDCLMLFQNGFSQKAPQPVEEEIGQIITRYIVRDSKLASEFFQTLPEEIREEPFFSTGVEDVSTVRQDVSTQTLFKTLSHRLFDQKASAQFHSAFLDCETHLGLPGYNSNVAQVQKTDLQGYCERLNQCYSIVKNQVFSLSEDGLDSDWLRTAGNLYHALLDMSRNAIADGFCYLVIDGAAMFCSELAKMKEPCDTEQLMRFQRFIRGWGSLIDQTMRLDGKFSQQPGFSPALCPIPSRLLELYLAFTTQCGKMMQSNSGDNSRFALLLVPKLCRRIKVESVFFRLPPSDRLLFVDVPIDILFDPFFALAHLCHEISHFCGESWRLREERKRAYLKICAQELGNQLDIQREDVIDEMYNALSNYKYSSPAYLAILRDQILDRLDTLIEDRSTVSEWIQHAYPKEGYDAESYARNIASTTSWKGLLASSHINKGNPINRLYSVIQTEYYELLKECYADVSNIFTLQLSGVDYMRLAQKEIVLSNRGRPMMDDYTLVVERWAITLHVTHQNDALLAIRSDQLPQELWQFAEDIETCYNYFFSDTQFDSDPGSNYLDYCCVGYLCDYLSSCLRMMKDSEQDTESYQSKCLRRIRATYKKITEYHDVTGEECWQMISNHRGETIQGISSLEGTLKDYLAGTDCES